MSNIKKIINDIVKVEGGYVDHPSDPGGATKYGITKSTARRNGYTGNMKDLSKEVAYNIYYKEYVVKPGYDDIEKLDNKVAAELIDTGINCGTYRATKWFQESLNAFNNRGTHYSNISQDGVMGPNTVSAFKSFKNRRGRNGTKAILGALDTCQGRHYLSLSSNDSKFENFAYGWFLHRVRNVE